MLKSTPIIAFVATTSPARVRKFYAKTLGLSLVSEDDFALVFDAGGTMLRVAIVGKVIPAGYTVLGWIVKDIRRTAVGLAKRGVKFRRYAGMEQDEDAIWTSPSGARVAWFGDPDGNTLSLTEMTAPRRREKASAKNSASQMIREGDVIRRGSLYSSPPLPKGRES